MECAREDLGTEETEMAEGRTKGRVTKIWKKGKMRALPTSVTRFMRGSITFILRRGISVGSVFRYESRR